MFGSVKRISGFGVFLGVWAVMAKLALWIGVDG